MKCGNLGVTSAKVSYRLAIAAPRLRILISRRESKANLLVNKDEHTLGRFEQW
ncbi:hypothetical protein P0D88_43325 [Paraburkholderia sp. RL18-103-BIB-C]|jgi:hypothetical protein|uniref:hypothetical protein n=1 Tax=unclassified Paraburkholderia TaxID=2615204 RepID=UPI0038BAB96A